MGHRKNPWEPRFDQHGWGGPPRGPGGPPPWVQGLLGWGADRRLAAAVRRATGPSW